jgi:hypothetical protein
MSSESEEEMSEAKKEPEAESKIVSMRPLAAETALSSYDAWKAEVHRWTELIKSGALPKHIRTAEMAIAIVRMGDAYGFDAMRSLRSIYIVDGRPEMTAECMLSLIREKCPEAVVMPVEMTDKRVTIRVLRPPQVPESVDVTVTIEQFAHLAKRDNWKNYAGDMLWARCVSRVARRLFPDVTAGAYTVGEIEDAEYVVRQEPVRRGKPQHVAPPSLTDDATDQRPVVEPEDEIVVEPDGDVPTIQRVADEPAICEACSQPEDDHKPGCPEDPENDGAA